MVVRAEQPQEVGTSNVVPTIIFAVSFLLAFLLAVGVIWISYGLTDLSQLTLLIPKN